MEITIEEIYDKFLVTDGVTTDSRAVKQNQLFVALKGDNFNGNQYAQAALEQGALFAIVDDENVVHNDEQYIFVENSLKTLQKLANFHRKMLRTPIIAITGSNGKTTTKELMHTVLSKGFNTYATKGNLNNHIGVPLSLLSLTNAHEIAIIEMGANHLGEIAALCKIAQPNFGVITNIGLAHVEGFGSPENIAKGKGELYDYLYKQQKEAVFVNSDDSLLMQRSNQLKQITYGKTSDYFSGNILGNSMPLALTLNDMDYEISITTELFGDYNFTNILCAGAVGKYFGIPLNDIAEAIEEYTPSNHRSQILQHNTTTYIVDAYNANKSSMLAALKEFEKINAPKKLAILGSMLEMGDLEKQVHQEIVDVVQTMNIPAYFVGKEFKVVTPKEQWWPTTKALKEHLSELELSQTTILLKGSRGIGLEQILPDA